jgi:WD40 repeat protein
MIPENRLEKLLLQAVEYQKETIGESPSLLHEQTEPARLPQHCKYTLEHHTDEVWFVQFSFDGRYLVSTSADCTALLYHVSKLNNPPQVLQGHTQTVQYAAFSQDNTRLLTTDRVIKLWNITGNAECLYTYNKHKEPVSSVCFYPDNIHFMSAGSGNDKRIRKWVRVFGHTNHIEYYNKYSC